MRIFSLLILFLILSTQLYGEEMKRYDAELTLGTSAFIDEETPFDHWVIGGSLNIRVTDKLSVAPQLLYMIGPGTDRDLMLTGNVEYRLASSEHLALYVVGGGGLLQQRQDFGTKTFTANTWEASGGLKAKFYITDRWYAAPEFRIDHEPFLIALVSAGYSF
jgi:hypothetical protein